MNLGRIAVGRTVTASLVGGLLVALAGPVGATGQDPPPPDPVPTCADDPAAAATPAQPCMKLKVKRWKNGKLKPLRAGRVTISKNAVIKGRLYHGEPTTTPFAPNQTVEVTVFRKDKPDPYKQWTLPVVEVGGLADGGYGTFKKSFRVVKGGRYRVFADHAANPGPPDPAIGEAEAGPKVFRVRFPWLGWGRHGSVVSFFQGKVRALGYGNMPWGGVYNAAMGRAVLAYRKVRWLARKSSPVTPSMYRAAVNGKGRFWPRHPKAGKHVEISLSRQVMALIKKGKTRYVFHISSGSPATPTIRGKFRFYRREPGFNNVHMYYSVYFHGGYATHGYNPVPNYPASHGCLRNPIPNSRFIYNWVELGMPIYIYG